MGEEGADLLVPERERQRRLTVGRRRLQPPPPTRAERGLGEEGGDRGPAAEPLGVRRHGHLDVLGQQRDDSVDVPPLPGRDERRDRGSHLAVSHLSEHLLLAALGECGPDRPPRPGQRARHGRDGRVQDLRGLHRRERQHVTQHQHRPLQRGEVLERDDEPQLHRLALLVDRVRRRGLPGDPGIGQRAEPDRLDERGGQPVRRVGGRSQVDRDQPPPAPLDLTQADVGGDGVEPGPQRAAPLEPVHTAPPAQQGLLHGVLGVVGGAEHPVAVQQQPGPQRRDLLREVLRREAHPV